MDDLNGRVAVVTGGGSGIGRGLSLGLAAEGMTVAVADLQAANAEAVAAEIEAAGGRALALGVDVTSVPSESAPDAHILTTASLGGLVSEVRAPIGAYTASKYACVGYSEMLRAELASQGIGVSVLCPGVVASNLMGTSAENRPHAFGEQAAPQLTPERGGSDAARLADFAMPAEDVGPIVIRAIRANCFHVITHPQTRYLVEERFRAMLEDFVFAAEGRAATARRKEG
jgi:NAD(P)-dependent dehydrogenase (short-subunit alcohol dehydrogenase family)